MEEEVAKSMLESYGFAKVPSSLHIRTSKAILLVFQLGKNVSRILSGDCAI
jgi:hypothetical protein